MRIVRSREWRLDFIEQRGGMCEACWATYGLEIDHVEPLARGGLDAVDNLQVLCGTCNRRKGIMPPLAWRDLAEEREPLLGCAREIAERVPLMSAATNTINAVLADSGLALDAQASVLEYCLEGRRGAVAA